MGPGSSPGFAPPSAAPPRVSWLTDSLLVAVLVELALEALGLRDELPALLVGALRPLDLGVDLLEAQSLDVLLLQLDLPPHVAQPLAQPLRRVQAELVVLRLQGLELAEQHHQLVDLGY